MFGKAFLLESALSESDFHSFRGMLNDANVYENPHMFDPERWLKPGLDKTDKNIDPLEIAFGFGRRLAQFVPQSIYP